jgi:hypothetical protein
MMPMLRSREIGMSRGMEVSSSAPSTGRAVGLGPRRTKHRGRLRVDAEPASSCDQMLDRPLRTRSAFAKIEQHRGAHGRRKMTEIARLVKVRSTLFEFADHVDLRFGSGLPPNASCSGVSLLPGGFRAMKR